jgi:ABC-2 type transport system permease protein
VSTARVTALIGKELREFRASPSAIIPVILVTVVCIALPFLVLVILPWLTNESLLADPGIVRVVDLAASRNAALRALAPLAAVQAFVLQQLLLLFLIIPIVGAVSLAAYSVVGEKQGRTLEPLLTTPLTTTELLVAKVLASFLPAVVLEMLGLAAFAGIAAGFAEPGVLGALLGVRSVLLVGLIGPFAALVALQMTIAVSSRVSDPRSAQQIAVLLVVPIAAMMVGQIAGAFLIPTAALVAIAGFLAAAWGALIFASVRLFDRERILTRWR